MPLTVEKRDQILEQIADLIERKGVTAPAILFLEANKPLSFVTSQALLILQPFLGVALGDGTASDLAGLLEDRANVELLIGRLERGRV